MEREFLFFFGWIFNVSNVLHTRTPTQRNSVKLATGSGISNKCFCWIRAPAHTFGLFFIVAVNKQIFAFLSVTSCAAFGRTLLHFKLLKKMIWNGIPANTFRAQFLCYLPFFLLGLCSVQFDINLIQYFQKKGEMVWLLAFLYFVFFSAAVSL